MTSRLSLSPVRRSAFALLCAAVLIARALVPSGFMLGNTSGHVGMVFCHAVGSHAHHPATGSSAGVEGRCAYAESAGPAPLPTLAAVAADLDPGRSPLPAEPNPRKHAEPRESAHAPRGPPHLV